MIGNSNHGDHHRSNQNLELELTLSLPNTQTPIPQPQQQQQLYNQDTSPPQLEQQQNQHVPLQVLHQPHQVPQLQENSPQEQEQEQQQQQLVAPSVQRNKTRKPRQTTKANDVIVPPFPWATNEPCRVQSLRNLRGKGITTITGEVKCKKCTDIQTMEVSLLTAFNEISSYLRANFGTMHDRAPDRWKSPETPGCNRCGGPNLMKPVIAENHDHINWLFLFLTQMLGCCTLDQLKYFCNKNRKHRTGAKDRVLYSTYVELCTQLDPKLTL